MQASRPRLVGQSSFRRYLIGRTVSTLGGAFGTLAVTFAVLETGGGATGLGIVLGAATLPALLLMLIGGVTGDRIERRRILVSSDIVMAATQLTAGLLFVAGDLGIYVLAALQLVRGSASAFFLPATTGFLPDLVAKEEIQSANALITLFKNGSNIVGPALAGITVAAFSPGVALLVDGVSFLVSAVFLASLPRSRGKLQVGQRVWDDVKDGWREFTSRPWVWQMVCSFAVYQATVLPAIFLLGPTMAEEAGYGAGGWAVILTCRAVGSLAAGVVTLRWRPSRPLVAATLVVMLDVPLLVGIATAAPVYLLAAVAAASSAGVVASDVLWESELQRRIPKEAISRVSSYDWMGSLAMNPLGNVVVGYAAAAYGITEVLLVILGVLLLTHAALLLSPSIRRATAEPVEAAR
jgi:MFS family permease